MKQVALRYPLSKVKPRVQALLPHIQADNDLMIISESKVMLMALLEGLEVLERRYSIPKE